LEQNFARSLATEYDVYTTTLGVEQPLPSMG